MIVCCIEQLLGHFHNKKVTYTTLLANEYLGYGLYDFETKLHVGEIFDLKGENGSCYEKLDNS